MKKLFIIGIALFISTSAFAQNKPGIHAPTGNVVQDARDLVTPVPGSIGPIGSASDPLAALQARFNAKLKDDLTLALSLANQPDKNGGIADPTAAPCYQALLDLNALVNSFTTPAEPTPANVVNPGVIAHFEQLRLVRNALQNQKFKDACAPLVQDIQVAGNQLIGQIFAIVGGAAKLGIAIP